MIPWLFDWLRGHPWGWFLVLGGGIGAFVGWLRQPVTWHNAEGSLVDDARRFARGVRALGNPIAAALLLAERLMDRRADARRRRGGEDNAR
ncbi:MAG: hypothetical protein ACKO5K_04660 [Armatimonadota bacterium]